MRTSLSRNIWAAVAFAGAAVIVIALMASPVLRQGRAIGSDLCPGEGAKGLLVIGIDATDRLSEAQRLDIRNRLESTISAIPPEWKVQFWEVAPSQGLAAPLQEGLCKPPVEVSIWTNNPRRARERGARFDEWVKGTVTAALTKSSSSRSPILEALQAIGLKAFAAPALQNASPKRLVLVSDLLQNTDEISLLRGAPSYDTFRASPLFVKLRPPLEHVEVEVLLLSRPTGPPAGSLVEWWQRLFADSGARLAAVDRIVG